MIIVTSKTVKEIGEIITQFAREEKARIGKIVDDESTIVKPEEKAAIEVLLEGGPVKSISKLNLLQGYGFGLWDVQVYVTDLLTSRSVEFVAIGEKYTIMEHLAINSTGGFLTSMIEGHKAQKRLAPLHLSMYFGEKLMKLLID